MSVCVKCVQKRGPLYKRCQHHAHVPSTCIKERERQLEREKQKRERDSGRREETQDRKRDRQRQTRDRHRQTETGSIEAPMAPTL